MANGDDYYMERCKALAEQAASKGNPAVGSIIVLDNKIVGEAEEAAKTKNDVRVHAEMEAIALAVGKLQTSDLSACTLYSTHEPCIMCSYAIRFYKIRKVIYLHPVMYLGGVSSSMPLLAAADVPPHWSAPPEIVRLTER